MSKNNFSNSVLITGANRGLGLGFVRHYLKEGYSVIATARQPQNAVELIELSRSYPHHLSIEVLDVSDETSIASLAQKLVDQSVRLDIVLSNAGIVHEEPFGQWTMDGFETHFRVNTIGPALFAQAIEPFFNQRAKLIQLTSGMGSIEWNINPDHPLDAYAMSKSALNMLSRRLAEKLRSKAIIVISMNPGWVKTSMGGPEAPTGIDEAIQFMTSTIEKLTIEETGRCIADDGKLIPW